MKPGVRIGEVVQSATTHYVAQVLRVEPGLTMPKPPPFGAFVKAELEEEAMVVYGLVFHVETASVDAVHRPTALNLSRQELREQQPQIFGLLRTDFSVVVTGFEEEGRLSHYLPPVPPMVHDFVYACSDEEVAGLTERLDFLRSLIGFRQGPTDELVASCLRRAYRQRGGDRAFLVAAGRALSNYLKSDYDRLSAILERIEG